MDEINFASFTKDESEAVQKIVERAEKMAQVRVDRLSLRMDLSAAHGDVGLRLRELANADDANFAHDVFGIMRHMDRDTGKLGGHFLPRFARPRA